MEGKMYRINSELNALGTQMDDRLHGLRNGIDAAMEEERKRMHGLRQALKEVDETMTGTHCALISQSKLVDELGEKLQVLKANCDANNNVIFANQLWKQMKESMKNSPRALNTLKEYLEKEFPGYYFITE